MYLYFSIHVIIPSIYVPIPFYLSMPICVSVCTFSMRRRWSIKFAMIVSISNRVNIINNLSSSSSLTHYIVTTEQQMNGMLGNGWLWHSCWSSRFQRQRFMVRGSKPVTRPLKMYWMPTCLWVGVPLEGSTAWKVNEPC